MKTAYIYEFKHTESKHERLYNRYLSTSLKIWTVLKFPIYYKSFASLLPSNLFLFNRKDKVHISAVSFNNAAWNIAVTRSRY